MLGHMVNSPGVKFILGDASNIQKRRTLPLHCGVPEESADDVWVKVNSHLCKS